MHLKVLSAKFTSILKAKVLTWQKTGPCDWYNNFHD